MNARLSSVLAVVLGAVLALAAAELLLRLGRDRVVAWVTRDHQPCLYVEDMDTGYRFRPDAEDVVTRNFEFRNVVRTNSLGFHDVEPELPADGPVILALGDSFTAAIHVPVDSTWTRHLARELDGGAVLNLGLSGTGTNVHRTLLEAHVEALRPDVVLLAFYENDVADAVRPMRFADCHDGTILFYFDRSQREALIEYAERHRPGAMLRFAFDVSYTVRALSYHLNPHDVLLRINRLAPTDAGVELRASPPPAPGALDETVRDLARSAGRYGFRLVVVPVPPRASPGGSLAALRSGVSAGVLRTLTIVSVEEELDTLRRREGLTHSELYWRHDGHFNVDGNRLFGRAVARALAQSSAIRMER